MHEINTYEAVCSLKIIKFVGMLKKYEHIVDLSNAQKRIRNR